MVTALALFCFFKSGETIVCSILDALSSLAKRIGWCCRARSQGARVLEVPIRKAVPIPIRQPTESPLTRTQRDAFARQITNRSVVLSVLHPGSCCSAPKHRSNSNRCWSLLACFIRRAPSTKCVCCSLLLHVNLHFSAAWLFSRDQWHFILFCDHLCFLWHISRCQ